MKKEELMEKGLTEEQAKAVMDAWSEAMKGFIPKERLDEVSGRLKEANATIETLKKDNQDNAELQKQVSQYKEKITQLETDAANTRRESALKETLRAAGAADADYLIYKLGGLGKFTFDKEGKPVGVEDLIKPMRETSPYLFKASVSYKPAGGGNPPASNPWAKESFNLTEQGRIYKENPALAKQMASAAGTVI